MGKKFIVHTYGLFLLQVVIPRQDLKAANLSASQTNKGEKYIQMISIDNHEFWFMGFVHYDNVVKYLQEAVIRS